MAARKKSTPTQLATRRREVTEQIAALTKEKAELDEKLLALDTSEVYEGDGIRLSFTKVHTLDTTYIAKKYPASKNPEFYKLALDTAEFKKAFSTNDLATMQKISYRINISDE